MAAARTLRSDVLHGIEEAAEARFRPQREAYFKRLHAEPLAGLSVLEMRCRVSIDPMNTRFPAEVQSVVRTAEFA